MSLGKQNKRHMTPYSRAVMIGVLAYTMALPTGYYGYKVVRDEGGVGGEVVELQNRYVKIVRVIDGDTVEVESGEVVRVIGIDAPETEQCYGSEAQRALEGLVVDRQIYLLKDEKAIDRYGRLLRYVFVAREGERVGDLNVGKEMVRLGYAMQVQVSPNIQYQPVLRSIQTDAQENKRGIWNACDTDAMNTQVLNTEPGDESCTIKGNISAAGVKRYFTESCRSYSQIKINSRAGEQWLCSENDAVEAGYEKSGDCF